MEFKDYAALAPGVTEALSEIGAAIRVGGLDERLLELAKIRASQINKCAQCLGVHLNAARQLGVDLRKLDLISVWQETDLFDEREMAVLAWTELLTDLPGSEIDDSAYQDIHVHFSGAEVAFLTATIAQINFYNRLGVAYRFSPPRYRPAPASS
jgi:AhpD family alkylhydroperoxidase